MLSESASISSWFVSQQLLIGSGPVQLLAVHAARRTQRLLRGAALAGRAHLAGGGRRLRARPPAWPPGGHPRRDLQRLPSDGTVTLGAASRLWVCLLFLIQSQG